MSETTDLPGPVAAFVAAINDADTEAFVALFSADGIVDDGGTEYRGFDGVRRWAGSDAIGAGAHMTILSATTDGDTTRTRFDWRSRIFTGESAGIFELNGALIRRFTIPPSH